MHRSLLLLPFLLTACPATDKDSADTGPGGGDPPCEVIVDSTVPTQGAVNADYRAAIEFHLSDPDPTAQASSSSITGTSTLSADNETVIFTPNAPLAANTSYTVTLDYCGGTVDLSFTTSEIGEPMEDPGVLVGKTFALALGDARIVEPDGIGAVLSGYLTQDILIGVETVTDTHIQMMGAIGKEDVSPPAQDWCDPTIDFPEASFSQPYFQIGPQNTTLAVAGYSITIEELEITGTFAPDGSYFSGGTLAGRIDTRPLAPLLDDEGDEGAICTLATSFGATCEACPTDGEPFCLTLVADQITAEEVSGLTLVEVLGNDCEGCESAPPAEDAVCEE